MLRHRHEGYIEIELHYWSPRRAGLPWYRSIGPFGYGLTAVQQRLEYRSISDHGVWMKKKVYNRQWKFWTGKKISLLGIATYTSGPAWHTATIYRLESRAGHPKFLEGKKQRRWWTRWPSWRWRSRYFRRWTRDSENAQSKLRKLMAFSILD